MSRPSDFTDDEVDRARRYHRPIYRSLVAETALGLGLLGVFAAWSPTPPGPWPVAAGENAAFAVLATWLLRLPLVYLRGFVHERRWGLSTHSLRGWALDRVKGLLVGLVLTSAAMTALVGLARAFPGWWPLPAATGAALVVLVLGFVAPLVLEPLFNRFAPLRDEPLAGDLRALADRARVPVQHVLVADASRRTTKVNAYVSGIGRTRRVVVWDTLLAKSDPREVSLVVAHELGHRRLRHVGKLTVLGILGASAFVVVAWAVLGAEVAEPRTVPRVLFLSAALEIAGLPVSSWISRRWERAADAFSIELTGDREAFRRVHRALALENVADLAPPRLAYALLFTHPTPVERLRQADA